MDRVASRSSRAHRRAHARAQALIGPFSNRPV
jgi:hypothetical protein